MDAPNLFSTLWNESVDRETDRQTEREREREREKVERGGRREAKVDKEKGKGSAKGAGDEGEEGKKDVVQNKNPSHRRFSCFARESVSPRKGAYLGQPRARE